ncbi:hypothetical protein PAPYR_12056 [Paratrimastix pyriformis]|uniref:Uncharacterized protein n=1 Tax=Paratrimastix pyriformis TaxID=342808 RepID=A0ABQ8U2K3_9EUKA|nr:hypothetical protein PAPYR_12056 [Paratrimastix pyriformis]
MQVGMVTLIQNSNTSSVRTEDWQMARLCANRGSATISPTIVLGALRGVLPTCSLSQKTHGGVLTGVIFTSWKTHDKSRKKNVPIILNPLVARRRRWRVVLASPALLPPLPLPAVPPGAFPILEALFKQQRFAVLHTWNGH